MDNRNGAPAFGAWAIVAAAGLGLAVALVAFSCGRPEPVGSKDGKAAEAGSAAADDVPEAVRTTLGKATQNHPMAPLIKATSHGKVVYETMAMIGTTTFLIRVAEDGKLLERKRVDPPPSRPRVVGAERFP
jgi:hypothetical protein